MRTTFTSLGIAMLVAVLAWASIIILAPGMNLDMAYGIIVGSFIGSTVFIALVLMLRRRRSSFPD